MPENKGLIFNIQRFSLHDGPGIRTTVFFKGCPLKCSWCHNPEGILPSKEIMHKPFSCLKCLDCLNSCPEGSLFFEENHIRIDRLTCSLCGKCVKLCKTNSFEICGNEASVEDIINLIKVDQEFYTSSGGGITVSGGEPFYQYSFLEELIAEFKINNFHVCLDTSGFTEISKFRKIVKLVDMILFDIKTLDDLRHKQHTGVSNQKILKNLKECRNYDLEVIIRTPIIPGFNFIDLPVELENHLAYLTELGFKNYEFIPYHHFGEQKYKMLGRDYEISIKDNKFNIIKEIAKELEKIFSIKVKVTQPILI